MLKTDGVKEFVLAQGADIVGVADASTVPLSRPPRPPQRLLPEAKCVIVFGIAMLNGNTASGNSHLITTQAATLYQEIQHIAYRIGRLLEKEGHKAILVPASEPFEMAKETRGLVGEISLKHCAIGAGLGVLGRSRMVLTKDYGPRINLGAVVTSAPLAPDQPAKHDYCANCRACVDACPVGAISENGDLAPGKCVLNTSKFGLGNLIPYLDELVAKPAPQIKESIRDARFWKYYQHMAYGIGYHCAQCAVQCPVGR